MEKMENLEEPLIADLNKVVEDTNVGILRAKAYGYDAIVSLLRLYSFDRETSPAPEGPSLAETPAAMEAAPTAMMEAAPTAMMEAAPTAMPAEDPGGTPRRRGRPRKSLTEEVSLLPAPKPPAVAEPVEGREPDATSEPESTAASDDDIPW